jgi:uncharacterized protein
VPIAELVLALQFLSLELSTVMEMLTHAIGWFEIPVSDFDRAKAFYSAIYVYEMPEMMMDQTRMGFLLSDMQNGGIGGAIVHGAGFTPSRNGSRVYLNGGADLSVVLNRVEGGGGKIVQPKTLIAPEMGYWASFLDTEGNEIGLHSMG